MASYRTFKNLPSGEKGEKGQQSFSVQEALEHIGMGHFQIRLTLIMCFAFVADAMEVLLLSILGPILKCEWNISTTQEALLTTVVFIGFFIGYPIFGKMADSYGRRLTVLFTMSWAFYFGILSGIAPTFVWMIILRGLTGFGLAGGIGALPYFSEFQPKKVRGRIMTAIGIAWSVGAILEATLALVMIDNTGWRWWVAVSALPLGVFLFLTPIIPKALDSCCLLADRGKPRKCSLTSAKKIGTRYQRTC